MTLLQHHRLSVTGNLMTPAWATRSTTVASSPRWLCLRTERIRRGMRMRIVAAWPARILKRECPSETARFARLTAAIAAAPSDLSVAVPWQVLGPGQETAIKATPAELTRTFWLLSDIAAEYEPPCAFRNALRAPSPRYAPATVFPAWP